MRNSIRYGAIVAALVACQAMAQTTMTLKVFTGGDNKASQWKEPANCSDPAPQFDSATAKGSADPVVTYSSGAQITWSVKVEVGGSVQLYDAYLGANYTYVPKGAANVVASLELRKDNATGPLAAVRGDSGAWAKWYSSINDGSTTSTRYTVCGQLDPFKLAAFPVAWSADDGTTWGKIIDKPVNGGPMDAAFYQYPSSAGYPATSTAAAGTLVGIGAGYQSFTWAADKSGIGVSAWSPPTGHELDACFSLLENVRRLKDRLTRPPWVARTS